MTKTDRRVQRTRERLRKALIELISEQRGYDAITIQDIVDRANVGRTAFYLHYSTSTLHTRKPGAGIPSLAAGGNPRCSRAKRR